MIHSPLSVQDIRTVAVLGAGTMGNGIAHVFARAGYEVILRDIDARLLDRATATISANLDREIRRGKVAESEKQRILARVKPVADLTALATADFVIEVVPERLELKRSVLAEASAVLRPEAILATNTSSISVTALAAASGRPERFIGMHFMNPVPVMTLVEVIRALQTSEATLDVTMRLCEQLGKRPVAIKDSPGFVSNRVLMPLINEAAYCVMEGVATAESVDAVMKLGMSHPMGPLELADLIGIDVCVDILDVLYGDFRDPKFTACPLLRTLVKAGRLGKKSGHGFYAYERANT
jgi:3-hydroxybutyryl-CoA dehydrogenase